MSADSRSTCPRCQVNLEAIQAAVDASYGDVPVETFLTIAATAQKASDEFDSGSFCEYHAFENVDGEILWYFRGSCDTCGLGVSVNGGKPYFKNGVEVDS